jgi:hypothetical protein
MADLPPYSTPRWVKILGIIALVVILLVVLLHLTGIGRNHGPGRHIPSGDGGNTPHASVTVDHTLFSGGSSGHTRLVAYGVHHL